MRRIMRMNKLSRQQQKYLRVIENKYLLPRWSDISVLLADIYKRQAKANVSDNEAVHNFVKVLFNRGRSTNDLILPPNEWLEKFRAYWITEGVDIPAPNEPEIAELIKLYEEQDDN